MLAKAGAIVVAVAAGRATGSCSIAAAERSSHARGQWSVITPGPAARRARLGEEEPMEERRAGERRCYPWGWPGMRVTE
eukprot:SAG22_NODE_8804_length_628_cov_2.633270_1_plen_79_part_00